MKLKEHLETPGVRPCERVGVTCSRAGRCRPSLVMVGPRFVVADAAAVFADPRERSLDHPAAENLESLGVVGTFDDPNSH